MSELLISKNKKQIFPQFLQFFRGFYSSNIGMAIPRVSLLSKSPPETRFGIGSFCFQGMHSASWGASSTHRGPGHSHCLVRNQQHAQGSRALTMPGQEPAAHAGAQGIHTALWGARSIHRGPGHSHCLVRSQKHTYRGPGHAHSLRRAH